MRYWLLKTEPETYSIDDLLNKKVDHWEGVRNFIARNHLREMKKGDLAFIYHTGKEKAIVGIGVVEKEAYPDPTQYDQDSKYYDSKATKEKPYWYMVDVRFKSRLKTPVTLKDIRSDQRFKEMVLVRTPRLSVQPVEKKHFDLILELGK